jgi:predicted nucleic acid-binding protein
MRVAAVPIDERARERLETRRSECAATGADLLDLRVDLFLCAPFASRVWELRANVTAYDAWYVALAESLGAKLATLDTRLSRAAGPRCSFQTPPPRP